MKISLQPFKILLAAVVLGPFVGLCYSYFSRRTLIGLQADETLVVHFGFYCAVLLIFIYQLQPVIWVETSKLDDRYLSQIVHRLLIAICCVSLVIFFAAGYKILSGESNRGAIRVELGLLGPIYAYALKYALPTIALLIAICFSFSDRLRSSHVRGDLLKLKVSIVLVVLCAFMSGAKFTLIIVCTPLVCWYWAELGWKGKLLLISAALSFMVGSHLFFQSTDSSLLSSINYVYARSTRIAAYGVLGCWDYVSSRDFETLPSIVTGFLGRRLGEAALSVLDPVASQMFADPHRLITVMYYPAYEKAIDGTTGLTLTLFGELVLHLRLFWFVGLVIFLGWFSIVFRFVTSFFRKGKLLFGIVGFIYLLMVMLPVLNSGLVFKMISVPFATHMIGVWLLAKYVLGRNVSGSGFKRVKYG